MKSSIEADRLRGKLIDPLNACERGPLVAPFYKRMYPIRRAFRYELDGAIRAIANPPTQ